MTLAIRHTAYDAELYPVELDNALTVLEKAMENNQFTETELGWARLLQLYLVTPIDGLDALPKSPDELPAA